MNANTPTDVMFSFTGLATRAHEHKDGFGIAFFEGCGLRLFVDHVSARTSPVAELVKHYPSGSVIEVRTITKPVAGTVKVYLDGTLELSGWSVDTTTGLVTFGTAPALGVEVTADFEFDVPARFDTDHMAVTIESYRLHTWQQIPIVELRD